MLQNKYVTMEEQLKHFRTILDTVQAGINVVDKDGTILYVNDAYCKMNGYSKEELIGKSLTVILPDQNQQKGLENYKKIINKKIIKPTTVESFNIRRDGTSFPVLISWNYLVKDGELVGMVTVIQDLTEIKKVKKELNQLKSNLQKREYLKYIMGDSPQIQEVHKAVENVAKTDFSVIIFGETGTGKEIIAEAIHNFSNREKKPLISVDCGAIPETLIESELFGYIKGAFTGAEQTRDGAFQKANNGTIFLDEIGNLSLETQKKLLRVLQEKEVQKIGSTRKEKLNLRIIAASNENIAEMVKNGSFRKDLFFRLNEFMIKIPPLRERKEDIPLLTNRFIKEICSHLNFPQKEISPQAMELLYRYDWPGNVRELRNALKRAVVVSGKKIEEHHFDFLEGFGENLFSVPSKNKVEFNALQNFDLKNYVKKHIAELEKEVIEQILEKFGGNKSKTARFLNIDYKTLLKKIKEFQLLSDR